ncbi:MAG: class I SAM-dependent methyltransferase [Burkholderiales bacterium]|jgi:SAM-dependent methyltransferase|nr:class I SAM-dependent methyltransferase [Burkholderiales bacterium]
MMAEHPAVTMPSAWVQRWAPLVPVGGPVLDVACGGGRHALFFAALGHPVAAVDRDPAAIRALAAQSGITALCADIETGPWPYAGQQFAAVVVTNYLHRPLFPALMAALAPGGVLIYETFALGNEAYGRPANPDFLLQRGELLRAVGPARVVAYEDLYVEQPKPAMVQRICAVVTAGLIGENPF